MYLKISFLLKTFLLRFTLSFTNQEFLKEPAMSNGLALLWKYSLDLDKQSKFVYILPASL